jgi:hypothetical protein
MQLWSLIPRLLSIIAVVSLLTGPMMTTPGAIVMDDAPTAEMSDMGGSMADAMPCCPHEKPALPDCAKSCPLAVLCLAKCFPSAPASSVVFPVRFAVADVKSPGNDFWRDHLRDPPPLKPPRA